MRRDVTDLTIAACPWPGPDMCLFASTKTACASVLLCRQVHLTREQTLLLKTWEVDPNQVIMGDRIAIGGFAEVFIGKYEVCG